MSAGDQWLFWILNFEAEVQKHAGTNVFSTNCSMLVKRNGLWFVEGGDNKAQ